MEVKQEGLTAIISIFANVAQFMGSLSGLLESGDYSRMSETEQQDVINNIKSISGFLNETGISIHQMIEDGQKEKGSTA